jgi:hypothetical protein
MSKMFISLKQLWQLHGEITSYSDAAAPVFTA